MATRLNLTRPELKRQRDLLHRFSRFLPMLKLKQQLLQIAMLETRLQVQKIRSELKELNEQFETYSAIINECSGVNLAQAAQPKNIETGYENIAGADVPYFHSIEFEEIEYDLFDTPVWVDGVIKDLRNLSKLYASIQVLQERYDILQRELSRTLQRVNLFEKVKIPAAQEAIRKIRIKLGDEMAAAVARAKAAKAKLTQTKA